MLRELHKKLGPVRTRLALRRVAAALATGLALGGWLALVAGLMALLGRSYWAGVAGFVTIVAVPLALVLRAMLQPATWGDAARVVDRHFQLHDRTTTALYLASHPSGDPFEAMQLDDAAQRVAGLPLAQAAPLALPWQRLASGVLLCGFALALLGAGMFMPDLRSLRGSKPVVVEHGADVIERVAAAPPAIDAAVAQRTAAMAARPTAGVTSVNDVAGRYFDRLQAPPKAPRPTKQPAAVTKDVPP